MAKPELDNLVKINQLKAEPPLRKEYDGMLKSAQRGLTDAQNESIETDSILPLKLPISSRSRRFGARAIAPKIGSRSIKH
jgi:hypothetical protein